MNRTSIVARCLACLATFFLMTALVTAQAPNKKTYVFKGDVQEIDVAKKKLSVKNENIEGWMAPMIMNYEVDNWDSLKTVKAGDRIEATVYDGDYKLYKIHTVSKFEKKK